MTATVPVTDIRGFARGDEATGKRIAQYVSSAIEVQKIRTAIGDRRANAAAE
jgi:hypothetical protein